MVILNLVLNLNLVHTKFSPKYSCDLDCTKFSTAVVVGPWVLEYPDDGSIPRVIPLDKNFNFILCTGYHR